MKTGKPPKGKALYPKEELEKKLRVLKEPSKSIRKLIRIIDRTTFDPEAFPVDDNFLVNEARVRKLEDMFNSLPPKEADIIIWIFNTIGSIVLLGED